MTFLRIYIHIHLVLRFAFIIVIIFIISVIIVTIIIVLQHLFIFTQVFLKYFTHLANLIFCFICFLNFDIHVYQPPIKANL